MERKLKIFLSKIFRCSVLIASKRILHIPLWVMVYKQFGEAENISWIFHCCQNCREALSSFWQQFQTKVPQRNDTAIWGSSSASSQTSLGFRHFIFGPAMKSASFFARLCNLKVQVQRFLYTTGLFVKRNETFPELQIFLALSSDRDKLHFLFSWPEIRHRKQNLSSLPELISITFRMESDNAQFYLLTQKPIQPQWPIKLHF